MQSAGPDEHTYSMDLELYGEIDDSDVKQVWSAAARALVFS